MNSSHPIGRFLAVFVLASTLAACGAAHIYRLRPQPYGFKATLKAIDHCARSKGYVVSTHDDSVHVKVNNDAWAYFNTDIDDRPQLVLHFIGRYKKASPRHPVARDAKARADSIWHCATRPGPAAGPGAATQI